MANPLHDREDFERLDSQLAEVLLAAAPAGEGEADAGLRQRVEQFASARAAYSDPDPAVAEVMLELAAAEEGGTISQAAVCAALRPLASLGESRGRCPPPHTHTHTHTPSARHPPPGGSAGLRRLLGSAAAPPELA
jgi:hypothetical protein